MDVGLVHVYWYIWATTGRERPGYGIEAHVESARRGLKSLEAAMAARPAAAAAQQREPTAAAVEAAESADGETADAAAAAARARFLYGLVLAAPGPLQQPQLGMSSILEAVEHGGYSPSGFLERFFVVQAYSTLVASLEQQSGLGGLKKKRLRPELARATAAVIEQSEALLAEPDADVEQNLNTKQAVMVALCDRYVREAERAKLATAVAKRAQQAATTCEGAIGINPAKEGQFMLLAKAKQLLEDDAGEVAALREVLAISPKQTEARRRLKALQRDGEL